ncbi:hypothetical protein [Ehrlichia japonica]|uniref:Uncharacterized protein n=1 Tax=Ehrlichia japonica TaxID=391036 RepID=X5H1Y3_9RICK|nr:hypothetical protein [Ehrlichia japonica]AHX04844.1 hypothetical protein EHF_0432 [Ehrlichia japonica]
MLLNDTYKGQSLIKFLSSVIQEDNIRMENHFLYIYVMYKNDSEKKKILKFLPSDIIKEDLVNCKFTIRKSDLIYLKTKFRNPFRSAVGDNEYNVRLMMYLVFEATDLWKTHCCDIYNTIKGPYQHDQRGGDNFFPQLVDYVFRSEGCPGRMNEDCIRDLMPLCFPNPELLKDKLYIRSHGNCSVLLSDTKDYKDSILFKVVNKKLQMLDLESTKLSNDSVLLKILDQKKCLESFLDCLSQLKFGNVLIIPFYVFQGLLNVLASDQVIIKEIENLLRERQLYHMVSYIAYKFLQDKKLYCINLCKKGLEEAHNIYCKLYGNNLPADRLAIENAISSLQNVKLNITANLDFFIKMNGNKGILHAQQYFRGLTALIESEINFLKKFKDVLMLEDLEFFFKVTCKDTHDDINRLLTVYDFFMQKKIVDRNAILKFTKKELSELAKYANSMVLLLKEIVRYMNNNVKVQSVGKNFLTQRVIGFIINNHPILSTQLLKNGQLISSIDFSKLLNSIEYVNGKWIIKEGENNKWFLYQLKLHPLMNYLDIDINCLNVPNELWDKELNDNRFFSILQCIVTSNYTDKKFIYDIKISRSLRVLQILYEASHFIPFSSLWRYYVNPNRYRTTPGYVVNNVKEKLYTRNKKIPVTSFSSKIIKDLKLCNSKERFIQSYYEAKFLKKRIRKDNNIAGNFEKLKTTLLSNKFIAYVLFGIIFVIMLLSVIIGRVLTHFNILPGIVISKLIDGMRGIFDTLFVVAGLDTVVDKVLILILDMAGIVVRVLDFILLCGLFSECIRFIMKLICLVGEYVYKMCSNIYQSLKVYGFKDLCIILLSKIWFFAQRESKSYKQQREFYEQKCDINSGLIEALDQIYGRTKVNEDLLSRINSMTQELSSQIDQILCGGKPKPEFLLKEFECHTSQLSQDMVNNVNYIKLKYEFSYLLNNYTEKISYFNSTGGLNILNNFQKRAQLYDKITAVNLQTRYFQKDSCIKIYNGEDIKYIFAKLNTMGNPITVELLDAKIASLKWAIHMLDVHDVYNIKDRSESVFLNTRIDHSITVMLYDCVLRLENYRKQLQFGKLISKEFIDTDIDSNFSPYIRDIYYILQSLDDNEMLNGQTTSMKVFADNFFNSNSLLLKKPSDQVKDLANYIKIDKGIISCISRVKKSVCEFMEYFQDPKSIAISFILYYLLRLTNSITLLSVANYVTQITDHVLDMLMLEGLYEYFTCTDFGRLLLVEFYQKGILFKDVMFMCSEFDIGLLCNNVQAVQGSLHCQDINYSIYSSSFHRVNLAQKRISQLINGFVEILCEGLFIKGIQKVINCFKKKMIYNIQYFILRENMISNSMLFNVKYISESDSHCFTDMKKLNLVQEMSCSDQRGELSLGKIDHMLKLDIDR